MNRVSRLWARLRSSLWFLPTVIVVLSAVAAVLLAGLHAGPELGNRWPRVFGASAHGSRQMLASIGGAMITVASVVLSVTIVALAQASSQYSPRVLRNFMRDVPTQLVLGSFVGCFAYCIVVLRTVRGGDESFVPSLAVFGAMAYAFAAIALLIYFIHHVAQGIQAAFIVAKIHGETRIAMERMFPGEPPDTRRAADAMRSGEWTWVEAAGNGYVTAVDTGTLVGLSSQWGRTIVLAVSPGDFVFSGMRMIALSGNSAPAAGLCEKLLAAIELARQRTIEQDPSFGIQQLVDIAVKALSPGINDPTTACLCVDRLGALLAFVAARADPVERYWDDAGLRVVAPAHKFAMLLEIAAPLLRHSRGDPQVLARVLDSAGRVRAACTDPRRLRALARLARNIERELRDARSPQSRHVRRRALQLARACDQSGGGEGRSTLSPRSATCP